MVFQWDMPPEEAFEALIVNYTHQTLNTLYAVMVQYAPLVEQFMRQNAPWKDSCMPGREYLKATAWRDDEAYQVGITAYYDLEEYRRQCPEPDFDWGWAHETFTFKNVGVIAIILPRRANTVLGDLANDIWDAVRALYESTG